MKYAELLTIPPKCATCPHLAMLAGVYEIADQAREELSLGIMDGEVNSGLFGMLLDEGMSIEEAEQFMVQNAEAIHAENMAALTDMDEKQEALVGVGEKLIADCRPEGAFILSHEPVEALCMSTLMAAVIGSTND